eukprot:gene1135-32495_t
MQVVAQSTQRIVASKPAVRAVAPRGALRVVAKASKVDSVKVALASVPMLIASSPAFALVDERMNGDGTGLAFGVNEGGVGWAIGLTILTMWGIFVTSQKDLGEFKDPKDGLDLDS